MIKKRIIKDNKIQHLQLFPVLASVAVTWAFILYFLFRSTLDFNLFNFLVFSIPGVITFVWGVVYLIALLLGYGLDSTRSSSDSVILNDIGLVKPKYTAGIHRLFLALFIVVLFGASFVLFLIALLP